MSLKFDSKDTIKDAKRDIFISQLMRLATKNDNRSGEIILRKAGLSEYLESYAKLLQPYSYNGQWENRNVRYAPEIVFDYFYDAIGQEDKEHQFLFLKSIIEEIKRIDYNDLDSFNRYLSTLGYKIINSDEENCNGYSLEHTKITIIPESQDISVFESVCESACIGSFVHFNEAVSTFRNGDYSSCVASCRKLLEAVVCKLSGESKVSNGIFALSGDEFDCGDSVNFAHDINQAINYWSRSRDKVYKFMRLYTLYNIQCGYGSHADCVPCYIDALWILNETQDTLYWLCECNNH